MKLLELMIFFSLIVHATLVNAIETSSSPSNAEVYFISPKDGDTVSTKFIIQFGLKNMGVALQKTLGMYRVGVAVGA